MAVYERSYRAFDGQPTPERWRFLVLPRYAVREVFKSKLFVGFLVLSFVPSLFVAGWIYLPYNLKFIEFLEALGGNTDLLRFQPSYYVNYLSLNASFAFFTAFLVGPALISADMRNNGLPLYLSRPFSRLDYVLGKATLLIALLSAVTWVPALLLFLLQSYLQGWSWFVDNLRIGVAIFFASWIWILMLCMISLALSAYMRWKPLARLAMLGVFVVLSGISFFVNVLFRTYWGDLLNISDMLSIVWHQLFGLPSDSQIPALAAWMSLTAFCVACLLLLSRKIKAYEVVR